MGLIRRGPFLNLEKRSLEREILLEGRIGNFCKNFRERKLKGENYRKERRKIGESKRKVRKKKRILERENCRVRIIEKKKELEEGRFSNLEEGRSSSHQEGRSPN